MREVARAWIDAGHRRLLATFREFGLQKGGDQQPDRDTLLGAVAFLEEEVPRFSRREEDAVPPGNLREILSFEHAFLQQEIDAFARAARGLARDLECRGLYSWERWEEVRRRAARVEAVLELHTEKVEDETLRWSRRGLRQAGPEGVTDAGPAG